MTLLNQPYSAYYRQLERQRRHEVARQVLVIILYSAGFLVLGFTLGMLIRS